MNLPHLEDKKLKKVTFVYEDGSTYLLDEENSENFQKNLKATSIIGARSYNPFLPVDWIYTKEEFLTPHWLTSDVTQKVLDILNNSDGKDNAKAEALCYLLDLSKENNDRNSFGIKKCLDYIDFLLKINNN